MIKVIYCDEFRLSEIEYANVYSIEIINLHAIIINTRGNKYVIRFLWTLNVHHFENNNYLIKNDSMRIKHYKM